jgi:hypothetical protein
MRGNLNAVLAFVTLQALFVAWGALAGLAITPGDKIMAILISASLVALVLPAAVFLGTRTAIAGALLYFTARRAAGERLENDMLAEPDREAIARQPMLRVARPLTLVAASILALVSWHGAKSVLYFEALDGKRVGSVRALYASGVPRDPFWMWGHERWTLSADSPDMVRLFLSEGDDVNTMVEVPWSQEMEGMRTVHATPLLLVAGTGNVETISLLLDAGADPNMFDEFGWTPLMHVIGWKLDAARLLVDRGAHVDKRTKQGTALLHAAWWRNPEAVRFLLDRGADVDATDRSETTPLIGVSRIVFRGNTKALTVATMLLDAGADVDARDATGTTALMRAAEAKNLTMVELLLARGADVNARDDQGRTALVRARGDETARMIEAAGGVK